MPEYSITLTKKAEKQLNKLDDFIATPIINAISNLADDPRPPNSKKLKNRDGYRIRIGNYRVIYDVFDEVLVVDVIAIGHRKDIYD